MLFARRLFRVATTLLLAAGVLLGAPHGRCRPSSAIQRYVIVSGSMTGTYDRGSVVFDQVVPIADAEGRRRDHLPAAAGAGPDHLVTHRISAITH